MSLIAAAAAFVLGHAQIDPNVVTWRTYKAGSYSKAEDLRIIEMDTLADYQQYLIKYAPEGAGDAHDINWNREELVAIHIGTRSRGGYSVEVSSIAKVKPTEACVSWAELTPARGVASTQAVTSPWTIVRLNRPGVRLTFAGRKEEGRLPGGIKIIALPGWSRNTCACCSRCIKAYEDWMPWEAVASGYDSSVLVGCTAVMSSEDEFANYVRNYKMERLGDIAPVDWYRERLVAIHLGRKMTDGYGIRVDKVQLYGNRIDVTYTQLEPYGRSFGAGTSTGPYLILKVPRIGPLVTLTKRVGPDCQSPFDPCGCGCDSCRH